VKILTLKHLLSKVQNLQFIQFDKFFARPPGSAARAVPFPEQRGCAAGKCCASADASGGAPSSGHGDDGDDGLVDDGVDGRIYDW